MLEGFFIFIMVWKGKMRVRGLFVPKQTTWWRHSFRGTKKKKPSREVPPGEGFVFEERVRNKSFGGWGTEIPCKMAKFFGAVIC